LASHPSEEGVDGRLVLSELSGESVFHIPLLVADHPRVVTRILYESDSQALMLGVQIPHTRYQGRQKLEFRIVVGERPIDTAIAESVSPASYLAQISVGSKPFIRRPITTPISRWELPFNPRVALTLRAHRRNTTVSPSPRRFPQWQLGPRGPHFEVRILG
jgi:hypothetical protein